MAESVPVFPSVSPVSSTFSVSLPLSPLIVSTALIALTLPPADAALLPTFTVSASLPVLIVVAAEMARTLTVSVPAAVFTVVVPATDSSVTASLPAFVLSSVVPVCVPWIVNVSPPLPRPITRLSSVP